MRKDARWSAVPTQFASHDSNRGNLTVSPMRCRVLLASTFCGSGPLCRIPRFRRRRSTRLRCTNACKLARKTMIRARHRFGAYGEQKQARTPPPPGAQAHRQEPHSIHDDCRRKDQARADACQNAGQLTNDLQVELGRLVIIGTKSHVNGEVRRTLCATQLVPKPCQTPMAETKNQRREVRGMIMVLTRPPSAPAFRLPVLMLYSMYSPRIRPFGCLTSAAPNN